MSTKKRAFTLVEMLITLTLFAVVSMLSVSLLVTGLRSARKIQAQVLLYSEAQALMDQMARDVERNAVDYEAYYARDVQGNSGWDTPDYGDYAKTFYDPGTDGWTDGPYSGVDSSGDGTLYGIECSDLTSSWPSECPTETAVSAHEDHDYGSHPFPRIEDYSGYVYDDSYMNAFCESDDGSTDCTDPAYAVHEELILVNGDGDTRTVYALKPLGTSGTEYYIGKMGLTATDTTNDGVVDLWACSAHYSSLCTDTNAAGDPIPTDADDFVALTPDILSIEAFQIVISPSEDPYRAFAEIDEQVQPQVTIILTVTLSSDYSEGLLGDVPSITIQRTVSTGVYAAIPSY